MFTKEETMVLERMAIDMDIPFYRMFSEDEACERLGVHIATIRRLRKNGKIRYLQKGSRLVSYFGIHLLRYFLENEVCHYSQQEPSNSEATGLAKDQTAPYGAARGSAKKPDKQSVYRLAQKTFTKQKKD